MVRALLVLGLLLSATVAEAPLAEAQGSLFMRGARAYAEGRYADAAIAFSDAYAEDPDPIYLYHLGLSLEGAGDVEGAIDAYFRFLGEAPDAPEAPEVTASLERLSEVVTEVTPEPEPEPEPEVEERPRPVSHMGVVEDPNARRLNPWPWVVTGGGAVVFAVGAILGGVALGTHSTADAAEDHATTVAMESEAQAQAAGATALMVIGALVTVGGATWGIVDLVLPQPESEDTDDTEPDAEAHLRIAPTGLSLDVRF